MAPRSWPLAAAVAVALALLTSRHAAAQAPPQADRLHASFDQILDLYVRDGLVYYQALKSERANQFDAYIRAISAVTAETVSQWPRGQQLAYWVNAYNAFVLQSVIDHYPIRGRSPDYPANSLRQVSGAFERQTFRAGGRTVTLDGLERDVIAGFGDARALLALGRGALGGARLRSEAYTSSRIEAQLNEMAREVIDRKELVKVDISANQLSVSAMFSWRESVFTAWAHQAAAVYANRSPLERAVLALIDPVLVPNEADFLRKNQFQMVFHDFDWSLNDLTGR